MKAIIVTTTFYKSVVELRFVLACKMVDAAVKAGYPVVIVDDSPEPGIANLLRMSGATVFPQLHKGMGPGRNQAFFHGTMLAMEMNLDVVVWMEPEKIDFVRSIEKLLLAMEFRGADIIIPRRSEKSWETWPAFQRESEEEANREYNHLFGLENFDPMFGPVLYRLNQARHFVLCDPEALRVKNTYTQHYAPLVAMISAGARVKSVEVDMEYPPEQKKEELGTLNAAMMDKRLDQRDTLIAAYRQIRNSLSRMRPGGDL